MSEISPNPPTSPYEYPQRFDLSTMSVDQIDGLMQACFGDNAPLASLSDDLAYAVIMLPEQDVDKALVIYEHLAKSELRTGHSLAACGIKDLLKANTAVFEALPAEASSEERAAVNDRERSIVDLWGRLLLDSDGSESAGMSIEEFIIDPEVDRRRIAYFVLDLIERVQHPTVGDRLPPS